MKWKQVIARGISKTFSLAHGFSGLRNGLRIMLYHSVGSRLPHDTYGISIRPELFEWQMSVLRGLEKSSVVSLSASDMADGISTIAVTFDDGYRDNLLTAAPILLRYGIPFTVFATKSFIQSRSSLYLNPQELRELSALEGVTIGSHGATHSPLTQGNDDALWEELYGSKSYIEDLTGKPVTAISYPHGIVDRRVVDTALKAGYQIGCCSLFGINNSTINPFLLRRTEIVASDSHRDFEQKISSGWDWYRWRQKYAGVF